MIQRYFNDEKLTGFEKGSVLLYFAITIMVSEVIPYLTDSPIKRSILSVYAVSPPFILYLFFYRSLRNIKMFIIWTIFGLFHLYLYQMYVKNEVFDYLQIPYLKNLQFTLLFILLFQSIRILHLRLFGYNFVSPSLYGEKTDMFDKRTVNLNDLICFFIYFPLWILSLSF